MSIGFWTAERLAKLEALWDSHSIGQLSGIFGRSERAVENAYNYLIQHKELKISSRKKGKKRVTIYAPGHAEGAANHRTTAGRSY